MKRKMYIRRLTISWCITLLICPLTSCKMTTQKALKDLTGNVYTLDSIQVTEGPIDQVQAVRIDAVKGDTLLIKYKIGTESFLDADFVWNASAKNYQSLQSLTYGRIAQYQSPASLYIKHNLLELEFNRQIVPFRKQYNKPVDLKTHRDPYYAEDGFSLYP